MSLKFSIGYLVGLGSSGCGYCKSKEAGTSKSFGIWIYTMTVEQYQLMLDSGWRRSGKYLYRPDILTTCCPPYTIRLDSHAFKPTKGQKKVLKKMQKYLLNGKLSSVDTIIDKENEGDSRKTDLPIPEESAIPKLPQYGIDFQNNESNNLHEDESFTQIPVKEAGSRSFHNLKMPILKADEGIANLFKTIENSNLQMMHKIRVELTPSSFSQDVYELYVKYQISIHLDKKEELSKSRFKEFLVDSPLETTGDSNQYGSFHQKYFIDEKLIAVAVIDILPNCVSSVYFLYDPSFGGLSLGTYSALREIATTFNLSLDYPSLRYYYLGFYIHSCPKMTYKAKYAPSELLCPYTFNWVLASDVIPLLDQCKRTIFDALDGSKIARKNALSIKDVSEKIVSLADIGNIKLVENNRLVFASTKFESNKELVVKLKHLVQLSGLKILDRLALVI